MSSRALHVATRRTAIGEIHGFTLYGTPGTAGSMACFTLAPARRASRHRLLAATVLFLYEREKLLGVVGIDDVSPAVRGALHVTGRWSAVVGDTDTGSVSGNEGDPPIRTATKPPLIVQRRPYRSDRG